MKQTLRSTMQDQLNRRQFLKATSVAALAAPLLLHTARGASARKGPNDRITMGVIGTGTQGRGLLNNFLAMPDTQVVAVCDVDTTRREHHRKVAEEFYSIKENKEYKGCTGYKDFRELLARQDIDAVVIAVPDHWHAYVAIAACTAGKDVYCEKPLSLTIHEARAMVNAARKYDRVFQTGSMQRSSNEFRKACELVRNGRLGKIKQVIVDMGPPSKPCDLPEEAMEPGLNWDMWLGPAPQRPYNSVLSPRGVHTHFPDWRNYREYSGGMMTDWGAHHFDIAQWGLGMDDSGPRNGLDAFAVDALRQDGRSGGAVAGHVARLGGHFAHHLRAHVLQRIFEFDFLGDRDTVYGDGRSAELLLEDHVAALRAKRYFDRVGQLVHAAQNRLPGGIGIYNLFRHSLKLLSSLSLPLPAVRPESRGLRPRA